MSRVPGMADGAPTTSTCTQLLGVVWADRGFWRRPAARRFECGGRLRVKNRRVFCVVCKNVGDSTWLSAVAPRTVFTLTRRRRVRALEAALRAGGLR